MDKLKVIDYNIENEGWRNYSVFANIVGYRGYHIYDTLSIHNNFICWRLAGIFIKKLYETY